MSTSLVPRRQPLTLQFRTTSRALTFKNATRVYNEKSSDFISTPMRCGDPPDCKGWDHVERAGLRSLPWGLHATGRAGGALHRQESERGEWYRDIRWHGPQYPVAIVAK